MEFSLQYESTGADIHATLRNGGLINYVTMPEGWWMTAQIANAPKVPHETEEGKIKVPVWWFFAAFQDSFWIIIDEIDGDKYAADCVIHAETLAFNADTAMAENWHLDEDGEPKYWITVEAFAHDFGKYSEKRFKAGTDVAPVTVYEEDIINIPNQAFPPHLDYLNHLGLTEMTAHGNARPWMRLQFLLHPVTPELDLSDPEDNNSIVAKLLSTTATAIFPALAATACRMAVVKLLSADLPYRLLSTEAWGAQPSLIRRCEYVHMLGEWNNSLRNETLLTQEYFQNVLAHETELQDWVGETMSPHAQAKLILQAGWGSSFQLDLNGTSFLNDQLKQPHNKGLWSDEKEPQANVDYLIQELRRRAEIERDQGAPSRGNTREEGPNHARGISATESTLQLEQLERKLQQHQENGDSTYRGIEVIEKSGALPAMRYLRGLGPINQLTPAMAAIIRSFPSKMEEYIVDSIKHDDDGREDPDLESLTVRSFYTHGQNPNGFFKAVLAGKVANIDWEKQYVTIIARVLNPDANKYYSMEEAYGDPTRRAMHVKYIGRLMDCFGKNQSAKYSYSALVNSWEPLLAKALQRGAPQDVLREAVTLMEAAFRNAQSLFQGSYLQGVPWTKDLVEEDMPALKRFEEFKGDYEDLTRFNKRFKASVQVTPTPHTGMQH